MMSRIPLGLWLCLSLVSSGCTSLFAPTSQLPGIAQQQPVKNPSPAREAFQHRSVPENDLVLPRGTKVNVPGQNGANPSSIQLGDARSFPVTSSGPAPAQKPLQNQVAKQPAVTKASPVSVTPQASSTPVVPQDSPESPETAVWTLPQLSTNRRPIEVSQAGLGNFRVLILGSIYGNEPESIELMDAITGESKAYAQSPSYSFVFIKTPNPDGLAEHIRTNHNGVDLNRNFPSTWFTATPNRLTGPHPASEVETQNLMRILRSFQPHRVIHVRSSIGLRPLVLVNDQLKDAIETIRRQDSMDAGSFAGEYKAGSVEEFVSLRIDAELMTIHLPPKGFQQMSAQQLFQLATTNFKSKSPSDSQENLAASSPDAKASIVDQTIENDRPVLPDGEKGYVEFLSPPPTDEPFNRASNTTVPADPKYYELPPPPGVASK